MAKHKSGLPDGFDLKVNSDSLVKGPAKLPGYLETRPLPIPVGPAEEQVRPVESVKAPAQVVSFSEPSPIKQPVSPNSLGVPREVQAASATSLEVLPGKRITKPTTPIRRLQINLSAEAESKVYELIELLRDQSAEKDIRFNDVIHAMIFSLYDARDDIDVSDLPMRGKWGSPTAKSFPTALAQSFCKALVNNSGKKGSNPFKQAMGS